MKNFESCYLVGLDLTAFKFPEDFSTKNFPEGQCLEVEKWKPEESLSELRRLANTAGIKVLGLDWQRREKPDQKTYVGLGKLLSISKTAIQLNAQILLFDDELTPAQIRAIETNIDKKLRVIDRTALVLDIFARHATSHEGKVQVELAQLQYRLPRLTRLWTHLARQGGGRVGGSVGLRGPGEKQIEYDRRQIRRRIVILSKRIERLGMQRGFGRSRQKKSGMPKIAIVGYTNAGKSSLMKRLSNSKILIANKLFATLDSTTKKVNLGEGYFALITDTVGFIQKLPHQLIAAFRGTLEEVVKADVLLLVFDGSDPNYLLHQKAVDRVLKDIGANKIPQIILINKIDKIKGLINSEMLSQEALPISAFKNFGIDLLRLRLKKKLISKNIRIELFVPYSKSYLLGLLRSSGHVENQEALSDGYHIVAYVSAYMSEKLRLQQFTDLSSLKEQNFEYSASNLKT